MSHEFSGVLQILLRRNLVQTQAFTQHFHLLQDLIKRGTLELKYFTDIRIPSNNARKKGKERKRLACDKVKYRLRNQFEVCGAFFLG